VTCHISGFGQCRSLILIVPSFTIASSLSLQVLRWALLDFNSFLSITIVWNLKVPHLSPLLSSSFGRLALTVGLLSVKLIVMVKRGSSTCSAAAVARSGLALGRTIEKTLALEAEVSRLRYHISVLSRRLHLSALESESLGRKLDALRSVAPLSREGDGAEASPLREEVADEVVVLAPVAELAALTVASLGAHVEALTVTTVASAVMAQEPEPGVAESGLPVVVQVERSPSADGAVAERRPRHVRWVDDEASVASRKAQVIEDISSSPPPVPAGHTGSPVASAAGGEGSDHHARDPGFITVGRGRRWKGRGRRH